MLKKHWKAFALSMKEIGRTDIIKHVIDTGDSKPVYVRPRRYDEQDQKIIDEQVKEMLEADIIKPSISPYNAPILLVRKGEKVRLCLDYRELNKVTKFQTFPLPTSQELFDRMHNVNYFSCLDFFSGFNQMSL